MDRPRIAPIVRAAHLTVERRKRFLGRGRFSSGIASPLARDVVRWDAERGRHRAAVYTWLLIGDPVRFLNAPKENPWTLFSATKRVLTIVAGHPRLNGPFAPVSEALGLGSPSPRGSRRTFNDLMRAAAASAPVMGRPGQAGQPAQWRSRPNSNGPGNGSRPARLPDMMADANPVLISASDQYHDDE